MEKLESCNLEDLLKRLSEQVSLNRLPPPEPTIFYGDPLKYPEWVSSFETLIERRGIPPGEQLHYLKRYLGGEAREAVEGYFFLTSSEAYSTAKNILGKRYGDNFIVAGAFRKKLETWPKIQARDRLGLRKFSDFLNQLETAMLSITSLRILDDERENAKALTKLPDWLVNRWARIVAKYKARTNAYPPFSEFAKFVREEADIACDPVTSLEIIKESSEGSRSSRGKSRTVGAGNFAVDSKEERARQPAKPQAKRVKCVMCRGEHYIDNCEMFLKKTVADRKTFVKERGLCFACLIPGHKSSECKKKKTCEICRKRHPTALHGDIEPPKPESLPNPAAPAADPAANAMRTISSLSHGNDDQAKSSMILPVWVSHKDNPSAETLTYALLDTQSDCTFILEDTKARLGASGPEVTLALSTLHSENHFIKSEKVEGLQVRGFRSADIIRLPAVYTRDLMPGNRGHIPTPAMAERWPQLQVLRDKLEPLQSCEIGLLIGYNCSRALIPRDVIVTSDNGPYAQKTDLGWSIVGIVGEDDKSHSNFLGRTTLVLRTTTREVFDPKSICRILERDFQDGRGGQGPSQEDAKFLKVMEEGIRQNDDLHYEMPLPLKLPHTSLPNSEPVARQRLQQLKLRLQRNAAYADDYNQFMSGLISKDFAEKVPDRELKGNEGKVWYIPHHGVYHPHKPNKIRVVFDASATYKGMSLNRQLLQGPDMTNNLVGILCRFRRETIALTCDVEQMFHQFRVSPEYRDFLRFLWWEDGNINKEPAHYRMKVHMFGATSSPGCANYALKHVAEGASKTNPRASNFIKRDFYVDDGITSVATSGEAIQLIRDTRKICSGAGLRLHKFTSNCEEVLEEIPEEDKAQGTKGIDLNHDDPHIERTLGVEWCIESDSFMFRVILRDRPFTRRGVLSTICSLYDPLGLVAPVILRGKIILQKICRDGHDWDVPLDEETHASWERWRSELVTLRHLDIARCYKPKDFGRVKSIELHHFSDASIYGYGQCSYLRLVNNDGRIHCSFTMGKSRVTPLKPVTIPRLELTAALVSTKISSLLQEELGYANVQETFWTDSKVVLGYISNEARRFHVFVANRVQQIRDHSNPNQWKYVSTSKNPADEGSRGLTAQELLSSMWLHGPDFLWKGMQPQAEHPTITLSADDPEVKVWTMATTTNEDISTTFCEAWRFSSWIQTRRAVATCLRYLDALRTSKKASSTQYTSCTVAQLQRGENAIFRLVQKEAFAEELLAMSTKQATVSENEARSARLTKRNSPIHKLDPFIDSERVLRVGGRLREGDFPWKEKHPVILPKSHHISTLIVRHYHESVGHAGRGMTINKVRSSGFWILGCSSAVRSILSKCVTCRRNYSAAQEQKMGNLPPERHEHGPPFTYVGADYFGPWLIKEGRKEMKRYGVLFTCMASRAIHIETTSSLTTDAFINALRRFIAIRGPVRELRSDRGTNFVGAAAELKAAAEEIQNDQVKSFLTKNHCDFKTNPPSASHTGGVWERQIRSVRRVLQSLMQKMGTQLDDESLRTLMCEVAAIINGRPLIISQTQTRLAR